MLKMRVPVTLPDLVEARFHRGERREPREGREMKSLEVIVLCCLAQTMCVAQTFAQVLQVHNVTEFTMSVA